MSPQPANEDVVPPHPARPTTIRYGMVFLAMGVAVLLYLDRICLSTASNAVKQDLGLSGAQLDQSLAAFFWAYALFQLPAGWLGDRYGARFVLAAYVALWSLSTGLLAFTQGLVGLIALRLACGMFEAGAYPLAAGIVRRWIPVHRRGLANSCVAFGGRLGGALAPIITIQLMLMWSFGGGWFDLDPAAEPNPTSWRPVMLIYGAIGIVIAAIFVWRFRDFPHQHPAVNQDELQLIEGSVSSVDATRAPASGAPQTVGQNRLPPLAAMCRSGSLWLNSFLQFASNFGWAFLVTSLPQYLKEVHQTTAQNQGWLQSLPLACGMIGMLLGGLLLDAMTRRFGVRAGRAIMLSLPRMLVGICFIAFLGVSNSMQATILLAFIGLATDLSISAMWAFGQDIGGKHVGAVVGWANMWGNLGAAFSPIVFGLLVRMQGENVQLGWQTAFLFCGVVQLIASLAACFIDASRSLPIELPQPSRADSSRD